MLEHFLFIREINKKVALLIALLIVAYCILLSGCKEKYEGWKYQQNSYGSYEVTSATGKYANMVGEKKDCIVCLSDSEFSFYDANHYDEPFFVLKADLKKESAKADEGKLDGEELTSVDVKLLSDATIEIPDSMWMEGTIQTEEGSLSLCGFFSAWHIVSGWEQIEAGDTGKLKKTVEELLPTGYELYKKHAPLSLKIKEFFVAMQGELPDDAVKLYEGTEYPAEKQTRLLRLDMGEPFSQVVLVNEFVETKNWTIFMREENGEETILYSGNDVICPKGNCMVIQMSFGDDIPKYELRFKDYFNREYSYTFVKDSENETVYLERTKGNNTL